MDVLVLRPTLPLRGRCILGVIGLLSWGVFILWCHAQGHGRLLSLCGLTQMCGCLASSSLECAVPDHLILVLYSAGGALSAVCGCLQDGSPFGLFYPVGVIGDSFYLCFLWSAAGRHSLTNWYTSRQSNTYDLHTGTHC